MISMSSLASPGGSRALWTRWTRRSLDVTVPSVSAHPTAAGNTTSASCAVFVRKRSWTTRCSRPSRSPIVRTESASDWAGFSPRMYMAVMSVRSMASNISVTCQPISAGISVPQAVSNLPRRAGSVTFWNPGSLLGREPMSPPPWTLFCPRSGTRPEP